MQQLQLTFYLTRLHTLCLSASLICLDLLQGHLSFPIIKYKAKYVPLREGKKDKEWDISFVQSPEQLSFTLALAGSLKTHTNSG